MQNFSSQLFTYTAMISVAIILGGFLPVWVERIRRHLHVILSFSAGLMLSATLLHLIPESFELLHGAGGLGAAPAVLAGFVFLYLIEKVVTVHLCEILECEAHTLGVSAVIGITAHALTDGIALGSGLMVSQLGFIMFIIIFFHKLPEAFALSAILIHEKQSKARIIFFNALLVAMVPLGAILVKSLSHFVEPSGQTVAGYALAFSAGTFLHISLSDLLPHVHEHAEKQTPILVSFLTGVLLMYAVEVLLGGHAH